MRRLDRPRALQVRSPRTPAPVTQTEKTERKRPRGDTSRPSEILRHFADRFKSHEWPGSRLPEVYYDPRRSANRYLHSHQPPRECVVIDERTAFVLCANFTEAAQIRNIEVGALIRVEAFAEQLARHFLGLAEQHLLERLPGL